ncbi:hypothetical protein LXL04_036145 [Taraxacum kok-saghyz]
MSLVPNNRFIGYPQPVSRLPTSTTCLAFMAISFELLLMFSAMADQLVNVSIASTIFFFPMIGLLIFELWFQTSAPTPTQMPKSSTSFALKICSAYNDHVINGTPLTMASSSEFQPQWLKNPPTAGCCKISTFGAHPVRAIETINFVVLELSD